VSHSIGRERGRYNAFGFELATVVLVNWTSWFASSVSGSLEKGGSCQAPNCCAELRDVRNWIFECSRSCVVEMQQAFGVCYPDKLRNRSSHSDAHVGTVL
jgi:hypothetical protein